jgi:hypothetical protein
MGRDRDHGECCGVSPCCLTGSAMLLESMPVSFRFEAFDASKDFE